MVFLLGNIKSTHQNLPDAQQEGVDEDMKTVF